MNTKTTFHPDLSDRTLLEKIAVDAQRPMEFVEQLYLTARTVLDREARIQVFIPVIALRRVKDALRNDAREAASKNT